MAAGRWYPTVTPLRNGEMLITSGGPSVPEVRTTAGSLRTLSTASLSQPLYPWIDVAPDGRAFVSGPDTTLRSLNTDGTGSWQSFGQRDAINRSYGGHVPYDIGKILVAGGGGSTRDARVIDINGATPSVTATASDGERATATQPDGPRGRQRPGDGRQLVRGGSRRPQPRRLRRRALESGERNVDDARGRVGDPPVPLDRAASPRRTRPVVGRRDLRHLRRGPLPGQERAGLHAAVPVQDRRIRPAGRSARDRRRALRGELRAAVPDRHARRPPRSPRSRSSDSAR